MRRGEIFKMRWADVRCDTTEISIPQPNKKTEESQTVGMTSRPRRELDDLGKVSLKLLGETVFGISNTLSAQFVGMPLSQNFGFMTVGTPRLRE